MADISLVHVVDGTPNAAAGINDNLDIIQTEINGLLNEDNLPALPEANVVFSGSAGHRHGGGTDGRILVAAAVPTVVPGTAKGTVFALRGDSASIAAGGNEIISVAIVAYNRVLSVLVAEIAPSTVFITNEGQGITNAAVGAAGERGYYWTLTSAELQIYNTGLAARAFRYCILYTDA